MEQAQLARTVLDTTAARTEKLPGAYLSIEEAERIVEEAIDHAGRYGDAVTYKYLLGHRRRLATTLTLIPQAGKADATCLDVGCFGYMAFWAWRYLGYSRVEGIELLPDDTRGSFVRKISVGTDELDLKVYNFDLASVDWPVEDHYDAVLFLETLEHINSDPMGVMVNVTQRMSDDAVLIMSVPNAISYKCLREFMSGMPPWNYWFYNPDLRQEPRHCFEYTPFVFNTVLHAAGLDVGAFQSFCAFVRREELNDLFSIGEALSVDQALFGDTLIAQARRSPEGEVVRYPDCIYDSERYYKSTHPYIAPIGRTAVRTFVSEYSDRPTRAHLIQVKSDLESAKSELERAKFALERTRQRIETQDKELSAHAGTVQKLRRDLADRDNAVHRSEERYSELNEHFFSALALSERLLSGVEQAARDRQRPTSLPTLLKSSLQIEFAKLLCTLGFKERGTNLWNRAKEAIR